VIGSARHTTVDVSKRQYAERYSRLTDRLLAVLLVVFFVAGNAEAQLIPLAGTRAPNLSEIEGPRPAPPTMLLKMKVYFKVRNQRLFHARADPNSPDYGRKMTTEEEDAAFGPLQSDLDAVSSWLSSEGFQVGGVSRHPLAYMYFDGTVDQTEKAFHISIVSSSDGHSFGNTEDPLIPARFANVILAIFGLSNLAGTGHGCPDSSTPCM
jgi:subtilase family serine protease